MSAGRMMWLPRRRTTRQPSFSKTWTTSGGDAVEPEASGGNVNLLGHHDQRQSEVGAGSQTLSNRELDVSLGLPLKARKPVRVGGDGDRQELE